MSKIEMARVIFQALHSLPCPPSAKHPEVQLMSLRRLPSLERSYLMALQVIDRERVRREQLEKVTA